MRVLCVTVGLVGMAWPLGASAQATAAFPSDNPSQVSFPGAPKSAHSTRPAVPSTARPVQPPAATTAKPPPAAGAAQVAPPSHYQLAWKRSPPDPMKDQRAVPEPEAEPERSSTLQWVGGLTLATSYATGLGIAAASDFANGSSWLAAPVVGPWVALLSRDDPCEAAKHAERINSEVSQCIADPLARSMLVVDGVLQATGLVLLFIRPKVGNSEPEKPSAWIAPRVGAGLYGLGMGGRF